VFDSRHAGSDASPRSLAALNVNFAHTCYSSKNCAAPRLHLCLQTSRAPGAITRVGRGGL
jgi:hypothetical protein